MRGLVVLTNGAVGTSGLETANRILHEYASVAGVLRATHAGTKIPSFDPNAWPEYRNDQKEAAIKTGHVYRLEVPIWPAGIPFEAGESLVLKVAGHYMSMMEFDFLNNQPNLENKGASHAPPGS
jgi:hypothetical protein